MTMPPEGEMGEQQAGARARHAPHIVMVAGEPSGDALGGQLMGGLKVLTHGRVRITGVGGDAMGREGLESLFPISETSVMGLKEVFPAIPRILRRVRETADYIQKMKPDVAVLIDSSGFNDRVARRLVKVAPKLKIVKYVAPQVWASRPYRAAKLAGIVDCVMTLFPFEPRWFKREGLPAYFVGNPVIERAREVQGGTAFRERHDIPPDTPLLILLPGSRSNEIRYLLPIFREAVADLAARVPGLEVVLPMVPHMVEKVAAGTYDWPAPLHLVDQAEKFAAFDAGNAALAASGTVTTELALAKVPMVVAYKIGPVTAWIFRNLIKVPFVTMVNIIEKKGVIPEFLQEAATPDVLADELELLLQDQTMAARQVAAQQSALSKMGLGEESPSLRAARVVLDMMGMPPSRTKLRRRGRTPKRRKGKIAKPATP